MQRLFRSPAWLLAGAVVCSAAAAEARPVILTEVEMDGATAGLRPDVAARLAALRGRLEQRREDLRERLEKLRKARTENGSVTRSRSWTVTSSDGVSTHVQVVSRSTYVNRND